MINQPRDLFDGDVVADINYFPGLGTPIPKSGWKTRYLGIGDEFTQSMLIHDVRTHNKTFKLDTHGFQFVALQPKHRVSGDDDEATIRREYYPELEELVKEITGATTTYVFNHVVRAHSSPSEKGILNARGRWQDIPSGHPHVDYAGDPESLRGTMAELDFPPEISSLFDISSRFAFLGIWRPLKPVRKDPLAVCDATTVMDSDYQIRLREFSRTGIKSANYVLSHREQHSWYYMSEMQPHEVVLFKGYDTKQEEPGWRCPHTAFVLPETQKQLPRESIEARVLCFWSHS